MANSFPRTTVGGVSLPRLLIGANWITGFSHRSPAADHAIRAAHSAPEAVSPIFEAFLEHDVNAVMGLFMYDHNLLDAVHLAEERTGKQMILIDEPVINMEDSAAGRHEAERVIKGCAARGSTFCLPLHSCVEELLNRHTHTIDRLPDYLDMIRQAGMIPGLSAHMPEVVQYADENEYDVETYIQIFNCMGFLMQVEIESAIRVIHHAKKPVMAIKPCWSAGFRIWRQETARASHLSLAARAHRAHRRSSICSSAHRIIWIHSTDALKAKPRRIKCPLHSIWHAIYTQKQAIRRIIAFTVLKRDRQEERDT